MSNYSMDEVKKDKKLMAKVKEDILRNRKMKEIIIRATYPIKDRKGEFLEIIIGKPHIDEECENSFICPYEIIAKNYRRNFYAGGSDLIHVMYMALKMIKVDVDFFEKQENKKLEYFSLSSLS